MNRPIYLDYAATTPVDARVAEKMLAYLTIDGHFANPSSAHMLGHTAKQAVEHARSQVADLLGADPNEIIWTSGATEANNLALKGSVALYQRKGKHIITMKTEHPSVLDSCQELEKQGFHVTYLSPGSNGLLNIEQFVDSVRDDTVLVSIMHINNETGILQDIKKIAEITASRGILLHVDAAQSVGKIPLDVRQVPVDLISFCAHKIYGPKGMGALYVRRKPRARVAAQIHGGGQEQGMRSGTLATHQIVGMGEAFSIAKEERLIEYNKLSALRERFFHGLLSLKNMQVNGDFAVSFPGILNIRFNGASAVSLIQALPELALSVGSACFSSNTGSSYVLRAMGLSHDEAQSSLRFSFGRFTCEEDIDFAVQRLLKIVPTILGI